jgi:hypothetical protein
VLDQPSLALRTDGAAVGFCAGAFHCGRARQGGAGTAGRIFLRRNRDVCSLSARSLATALYSALLARLGARLSACTYRIHRPPTTSRGCPQ